MRWRKVTTWIFTFCFSTLSVAQTGPVVDAPTLSPSDVLALSLKYREALLIKNYVVAKSGPKLISQLEFVDGTIVRLRYDFMGLPQGVNFGREWIDVTAPLKVFKQKLESLAKISPVLNEALVSAALQDYADAVCAILLTKLTTNDKTGRHVASAESDAQGRFARALLPWSLAALLSAFTMIEMGNYLSVESSIGSIWLLTFLGIRASMFVARHALERILEATPFFKAERLRMEQEELLRRAQARQQRDDQSRTEQNSRRGSSGSTSAKENQLIVLDLENPRAFALALKGFEALSYEDRLMLRPADTASKKSIIQRYKNLLQLTHPDRIQSPEKKVMLTKLATLIGEAKNDLVKLAGRGLQISAAKSRWEIAGHELSRADCDAY